MEAEVSASFQKQLHHTKVTFSSTPHDSCFTELKKTFTHTYIYMYTYIFIVDKTARGILNNAFILINSDRSRNTFTLIMFVCHFTWDGRQSYGDAHFVLNINVGASVQEKFNNGRMAVRRGDGESGLIKL